MESLGQLPPPFHPTSRMGRPGGQSSSYKSWWNPGEEEAACPTETAAARVGGLKLKADQSHGGRLPESEAKTKEALLRNGEKRRPGGLVQLGLKLVPLVGFSAPQANGYATPPRQFLFESI